MAIRIIHNVADEDLADVEENQWNNGATEVTSTRDGIDTFTVTAIFPDRESHAALQLRLAGREEP